MAEMFEPGRLIGDDFVLIQIYLSEGIRRL
jgi:hypothetical protein